MDPTRGDTSIAMPAVISQPRDDDLPVGTIGFIE